MECTYTWYSYIDICNGRVDQSAMLLFGPYVGISKSPVRYTPPKAVMTDIHVLTFGNTLAVSQPIRRRAYCMVGLLPFLSSMFNVHVAPVPNQEKNLITVVTSTVSDDTPHKPSTPPPTRNTPVAVLV